MGPHTILMRQKKKIVNNGRLKGVRGVNPAKHNAQKKSCHRGHPFTADNTYLRDGRRYCRECNRERNRAWKTPR